MKEENHLQRFIQAQERDYGVALGEIRAGRKRSHWMWYIFPQIRGLGFSEASRFYGIRDAVEAAAYLAHPVLGPRLTGLCGELLRLPGKDARQIFGSPDDLKLKSSMTLFAALAPTDPVFQEVLDKFYQGSRDPKTLQLLGLEP